MLPAEYHLPELRGREFRALESFASPLYPAGEILDGVPVGEGVDAAYGHGAAVGEVGGLADDF